MRKLTVVATVAMTLMLSAGTSSATSPTTAQFQPYQVVLASTGGAVFVLGFKSCGTMSCPELWAGTGTSFVQRVAAPGTTPRYMSQLVFANGLDGYAFNTKLGDYATTNGGINWTHVSFGREVSLSDVVTSDGWFYGVTEHCVVPKGKDLTCDDYRLARSRVGSVTWSSISIPGTGQLSWQRLGLTAWGREVTVQTPWLGHAGETLLRSFGGRAPLRVVSHDPEIGSVTGACDLTATSASSMWAICGTGMMEAWLYSSDGGDHFKRFWWPFGTAGVVLDPVSGRVAFRYTGIELPRPSELELTTNGGTSFIPIAHLGVVAMAFQNRLKGYVVGATNLRGNNPELLQTSDGGHSWHKVVFESSTQ
jgi:hypothetical protein